MFDVLGYIKADIKTLNTMPDKDLIWRILDSLYEELQKLSSELEEIRATQSKG